jgi:GMP synthase (glutamine-hydrolysing)
MVDSMKKIVLIQTGQPVQQSLDQYGDFDKWFIESLQIQPEQVDVHRVFEDLRFPEDEDLAGIIISGSPSMITQNHTWSKKTKEWLKPHLDKKTPILGVCYGHQLLARLLGGTVDWNPNGREIGQVSMQLTEKAKDDKLFSEYYHSNQKTLKLYASHMQSVIYLPETINILGTTQLDSHHCFSYNNHVWGFQFHPEFNAAITRSFLKARSESIINEGLDYQGILESVEDSETGSNLLKAFKKICYS